MFIEGCVWLMSGQLDSFINLAPTINIGLSSDIRLILPNQTVYDAYKYHTSSVLKLVQCGEDAISKCPSTSDRYNLEGTTLKGSIVVTYFIYFFVFIQFCVARQGRWAAIGFPPHSHIYRIYL